MKAAQLHRSLTFRLALLYLLVLSGSIALLLALAWWGGVKWPLDRMERQLAQEAAAGARAYHTGGPPALQRVMDERPDAPSRPYFALVGPGGELLAGASVDDVWPFAEGWVFAEFEDPTSGRDQDSVARAVTLGPRLTLFVGRESDRFEDREDLILETAKWSGLIAPPLGLLVGLLTSVAVSRRIEAVTATARRVMRGDLSERVEVRGTGDDFDQLAETLNLMLARIEDLVQSVSRVSDHVAHELRTPLTRLRAELDLLGRDAARGVAAPARIDQALAEANRLQSIFDALLRIARLEAGRHDGPVQEFDVGRLLHDVIELYQPEAEAKDVRLSIETADGLMVRGDPDLLFQAVCNLMDNAVKFVGPGARVEVVSRAAAGRVQVAVRDNGPGIPPELRERVVERFYRAPGQAGVPGVGLGLPLVAAVCVAHGGELTLEDAAPGLRASLTLPAA